MLIKNMGVRGKFIWIISIATVVLLTCMALVIIWDASKSQSRQAGSFISTLKAEQIQEEKLLRKTLINKGKALTDLMTQIAAGLIIGFDFDTLEQVAKHGARDSDISFVTFFDKEGKPVTKQYAKNKDMEVIKEKVVFEKELVGFVEVCLNFDSVEKVINQIAEHTKKLSEDTRAQNESARRAIINIIVISILATMVLLFIVIYWAVSHIMITPLRRTILNLNEGADQVSSASTQVSSASQSLAEGASEQAASIEETSSSLEEMSSMTKQNADNAGQANTLMKEANHVINNANDSMGNLTTSMKDISNASEETQKIIKTIDEVAFQTNLLALNAAVEAARAGEAGAGFAVVADEVRNLAIRAADAAKNTSDLIEGTVKKVKEGSELVTNTNEAFTQVAESASKVGELVGEIAAASNEQAQGIEQINTTVTQMDKVTQQNAANAEESASASEEMNSQAEQMKGMVGELVALVGGSGGKVSSREYTVGRERKMIKAPAKRIRALTDQKARKQSPEEVIPMGDDDFKDF